MLGDEMSIYPRDYATDCLYVLLNWDFMIYQLVIKTTEILFQVSFK